MATKILIVDDNLDSLDLLELLLQRTGYETMTAPTGESGLASARQERPDLILLDIVLPDMDGYQVLEALRSSKETRGTPVILITGKAQEGEKMKAHRAGADAYLQRPFSPQELFRSIKGVLGEGQ
ncbi:MAG: response regulator [Anaerolineales bacterium]